MNEFTNVPKILINNPNIKIAEKMVYLSLLTFKGNQCICYPSIKKLSEYCNLSTPTIIRALKGLNELGAIKTVQRFNNDGGKTSNCYIVAECDWRTGEFIFNYNYKDEEIGYILMETQKDLVKRRIEDRKNTNVNNMESEGSQSND